MGLALLIILLALVVGGVGLAVKAVWWLIFVGVVLLIWGRDHGRKQPLTVR